MAGNAQQKPKKNKRRNRGANKKIPGIAKTVNAAVAKSVKTRNVAPIFRQTREGCTITHREYITDITSSAAAFLISVFNINGGLVSSFPWLSQVASRFESYTFERLNYIYEPMVPTSTPGSLMMAIDFDATDSAPANKVTLMSYAGATRSSVFDTARLSTSAIDRKKMVHERYVRSGALVGNNDLKTYDVGNLYVATVGTPNAVTTILGELYVEYTVRLRTPQIQTAPNLNLSGRRAAQQGTISFGIDGKITSHVAEITGEGNQPVLQAIPGEPVFRIDPRIKRCLLTLATTPSANWTQAVTTCFSNLRTDSIIGSLTPLIGNGASSSVQPQMYGASTMASFTPQTSVTTTARPMIEQYIVGEMDSEQFGNTKHWGTMINDIIIGIRDNLGSAGTTYKSQYSILPLDTDSWPKLNAAFQSIVNANANFGTPALVDILAGKAIEWPTVLDPFPSRTSTPDGQVFTFHNRVDLTKK
jgi:hypothetical protein